MYNTAVYSLEDGRSAAEEAVNNQSDVHAVVDVQQQEVTTLSWLSMINRRNEALAHLQSILSQNAAHDQTLSRETFCHLFSQTV